MSLPVEQKAELAIQALLQADAILLAMLPGGADSIRHTEDVEDLETTNITISATGKPTPGLELDGNRDLDVRVRICSLSLEARDTSGNTVDVATIHNERIERVREILQTDSIAADLSALQPDFTAQGFEMLPESGASPVGRSMLGFCNFRLHACADADL